MNDESRSLVTIRPFRRPTAAPERIAVRTPSVMARPRFGYCPAATCSGVPPTPTMTLAARTEARISDWPTDRSRCPAPMRYVIPIARIMICAAFRPMDRRLLTFRYTGLPYSSALAMPKPIARATMKSASQIDVAPRSDRMRRLPLAPPVASSGRANAEVSGGSAIGGVSANVSSLKPGPPHRASGL